MPGERRVFEAGEFFFEDFGLEIGLVVGGGRGVEFQMEGDAEGRFAGADGPAGENIFGCIVAAGIVAFEKFDLMGADADLLRGAGEMLRDAQAAAPGSGFDFLRRNVAGRAEILAAGEARDFGGRRMSENFFFGAEGGSLALREDEQIRAEAVGFFDIVGDEKRGAAIVAESGEEFVLDSRAQVRIERRERFIEQQRFGSGGESASERGALLFATGKLAGAAIFEAIEMQRGDLIACAREAFVGREAIQAEGDIFGDGEMREKRVTLKKQADAAIAAGNVDMFRGIEKHAVVERDAAGVRALEAGDAAKQHGLAGAAGAENG